MIILTNGRSFDDEKKANLIKNTRQPVYERAIK